MVGVLVAVELELTVQVGEGVAVKVRVLVGVPVDVLVGSPMASWMVFMLEYPWLFACVFAWV